MDLTIDTDVRSVLLGDENLERFVQLLSGTKGKTVRLESIWTKFCSVYQDLPSGRERRVWLRVVLEELDGSEEITLPITHGKQWDRTSDIPLPTKVTLRSLNLPSANSDWRSYAWNHQLEWVHERKYIAPSQIEFLYQVNRGLAEGWFDNLETMKYRSLQLTGDEKRLTKFAKTKMFGTGRLSFRMLGCDLEMLPIAYERINNQSTMLMFENAAPFIAARRIAQELAGSNSPLRFGTIAYGAGKQIVKSEKYLSALQPKIERVQYVGDLDAEGLEIASDLHRLSSNIPVEPATRFHQAMLKSAFFLGHSDGWCTLTKQRDTVSNSAARFLHNSIRQRCIDMIGSGKRIPEEALSNKQISKLLCVLLD